MNSYRTRSLFLMVGALCTAAALAVAASPAAAQGTTGKFFSYKPPSRGAPSAASRVGGGTRGPAVQNLVFGVLAPTHVAETVRQQPTLYWFNSEPLDAAIELVVVDQKGVNPLLETKLKPPFAAGVHAVSLKDFGVTLAPEGTYQWYVAVVLDAKHRSQDLVSGGDIRVAAANAQLNDRLQGAAPADRAALLAEAGIWYDVIDELSTGLRKAPKDSTLREQRAQLLEQVGLKAIADGTRSAQQ